MTDREAQDLIRMIESNWNFDLEKARGMWRQQLMPFDAEIATQAVVRLARTQTWQPRLADVLEVIRTLSPPAEKPLGSYGSCDTCDGDLFVVVYIRKPVTTAWMDKHGITASPTEVIEEMAPCPECNGGANTSFRRNDGREVVSPDPGRVREILSSTTLRDV